MWYFIHNNLLWSQGQSILLVLLIVMVIGLRWWRPLVYLALIGFFISVYFFRNPERVCIEAQSDESVLVCPADGTVVDMCYGAEGELDDWAQRISIYLSPFDVHVTWTPMAARVTAIEYRKGRFLPAFLAKSSLLNEHNDIELVDRFNRTIKVRQIAGTIAGRICCWIAPDDLLSVGQKIGMIRFGSRVDLFLPSTVELAVGVGQRVYGGQTVIGRWSA